MSDLHLSRSLEVPVSAVTETFAVLGKRGSGKTSFGVVLVEELLAAEQPVVVIDPVGVWWGLRLDRDGKRKGHEVIVIGGPSQDVPLEVGAGKVLAQFVVESRRPCVLDLSDLVGDDQNAFMLDFAKALYHRQGSSREPLHVVIDEADAYAPQDDDGKNGRALRKAIEVLIRRGRSRGIGMTLITQRAAVLHKNVLTQASFLVAFQMIAPQDRKSVDEWVKKNADEEALEAMRQDLPRLPVGDAFVFAPGFLDEVKRVHFRQRRTFDSSATPTPGKHVTRRSLPAIDLHALKKQISATLERAKEEDPQYLRDQIAELRRELAVARKVPPPAVREVVPQHLLNAIGAVSEKVLALATAAKVTSAHTAPAVAAAAGHQTNGAIAKTFFLNEQHETRPAKVSTPSRNRPPDGSVKLGDGQRKILTVLAQSGPLPTMQVAIRTGYVHGTGHFSNMMGELRAAELIEGGLRGAPAQITPKGLAELGPFDPLPTGRAILDYWIENAGGAAHGRILKEVASVYPGDIDVKDLAERTGYAAGTGHFTNMVGRLRTLQLITGKGRVKLGPELAAAVA